VKRSGLRRGERPGQEKNAKKKTAAKNIYEIHATPEFIERNKYNLVSEIKYIPTFRSIAGADFEGCF
jgi:hypothetical protein